MGEGTVDLFIRVCWFLAEFLIWAPVGICHARVGALVLRTPKLPRRKMPPATEVWNSGRPVRPPIHKIINT